MSSQLFIYSELYTQTSVTIYDAKGSRPAEAYVVSRVRVYSVFLKNDTLVPKYLAVGI